MNLRSVILAPAKGLAGGLAGAFAGHWGVILTHRFHENASQWLQGAHGPPFFDLALSTSLFYAALGAILFDNNRRLAGAGIGFVVSFVTFACPMAVSTRIFSWGEGPVPQTLAWFYLVLGTYAFSNLGVVTLLGCHLQRPFSWRRGTGAVLGAAGAYLIQLFLRWFWPEAGDSIEVIGLLPPPSAVYGGILWGGLIVLGATLLTRKKPASTSG